MKNPTVEAIVTNYLKDNGYDGLYTEGCDCLLGDLCPCGCEPLDCRAGHKALCLDCNGHLTYPCEWHVGPERDELERVYQEIERSRR